MYACFLLSVYKMDMIDKVAEFYIVATIGYNKCKWKNRQAKMTQRTKIENMVNIKIWLIIIIYNCSVQHFLFLIYNKLLIFLLVLYSLTNIFKVLYIFIICFLLQFTSFTSLIAYSLAQFLASKYASYLRMLVVDSSFVQNDYKTYSDFCLCQHRKYSIN